MADERCLADEQVLGAAVARVPGDDRRPGPAPHGQPDHPVGDAGLLRITAPCLAPLEDRPRDVPLQQVQAAPAGVGQVGQLADQQALAGAGQPGEEDQPRVPGQCGQGGGQRRIAVDQHSGDSILGTDI